MRKALPISFVVLAVLLVGTIAAPAAPTAEAGQRFGGAPQATAGGDGPLDALTYRYIGPVGNRVSAVTGVPGDANIYYVGAASGGVFRSTDAGASWEPVFDDQPVQAIGSLAVDPVNTNVVWAGTGETFIRSNILTGNGIYKSVDGGDSWQHMGLEKSGRIGRVIVDPHDPDTVFAAVMGHGYDPNPNAACTARTTAGRRGRTCCSSTRTPAPRTSSWTPTTPTSSSPAPGRS